MTILEMNDLELRQGCQKLHVILENTLPNSKYRIFLTMINVHDTNPRSFPGMIVTGKDPTSFHVDLGHITDSANYRLSYVIIDEDPVQLKPSGKPLTITMPEAASRESAPIHIHKWKHYHGIMESYDYCEICDKKRF